MAKQNIYLDYAAATPVDKRVLRAMEPYFSEKFHNPASDTSPSREVQTAINIARKTVAGSIGAKPAEIIFTAGGTEANNLAIFGVATKFPGGEVVSTHIEHESVLKPLDYLKNWHRKVHLVRPKKDGIIEPEKITAKITDKTVLVSVIYANNEIGTIQPLKEIVNELQIVRKNRLRRGIDTPLYLHSDACQATNYLDMHAKRLGVDLMTINSGKIYGPKQCGALFIRAPAKLNPLIFGGGQERGLRSGTENVPAVIGFAQALKITDKLKKEETRRLEKLRSGFIQKLTEKIPSAIVNGSLTRCLPNNIHVTFPGVDNEKLLIQLDEAGIYASAGSACSASSDESSHVLRNIGLSDELARSSLRFSLGRDTDAMDVEKTIKVLAGLLS